MSRPASGEATALILAVAAHYRAHGGIGFADSVQQAEQLLEGFWYRTVTDATNDELWALIFKEFGG